MRIYPQVLNVEGGYVNDPKDPGGPTKYGIAYNFNQGYLRKFGIVKPDQMPNLTREQAIEIYYVKYWVPSQADEIPDARLALCYFDHAINAGVGAADQLLAKQPKIWFFKGDGPNRDYFMLQVLIFMLRRLRAYSLMKQYNVYGEGWFNRLLHIADALRSF